MKTAIFAGGCFWGMEALFKKANGVLDTEVGYIGGNIENPNYEIVKTGASHHAEAILITYDEKIISYLNLLQIFFQIHDPTTINRQGNDVGSQYRSAIFTNEKDEIELIKLYIEKAEASGKWPGSIITSIEPRGQFWSAEEFHQDYLDTRPNGYSCHLPRASWRVEL